MKKSYFTTLVAAMLLSFTGFAAEIVVKDSDINPGQKVYWTSDNTYILDKLVFVEDGAKLYIEAGTVIKGRAGQEYEASALIISRGGQIFAEGTPDYPIIFTAEADDPYDLSDLPMTETGLWGGLIILGRAQTNNPSGTKNIEGISETEPRGTYGMPIGQADNMDNSGVIRYVSIRHGGTDIGDGNEINGLTMGAVGAGTTIEFVEVFYNADDGFEWFGGTVNTRYLVSAFNKDDSFDYDEGFSGRGQFWFAIQAPNRGNMSGEHDGGNKPDDSTPYAKPIIYNATYIGSGVGSNNTKSKGVLFRDNAGGTYRNSIFTETTGRGLEIEDLASGEDSRKRLEAGDLNIQNNIWWNIGKNNTTIADIAPDVSGDKPYGQDFVRSYLGANNNWIENPGIKSISRAQDGGLDPRLSAGASALSRGTAPIPSGEKFFEPTDYIGAFGSGDLWLDRWTFLWYAGVTKELRVNEVVVNDQSINAGEKVTWTADNIYILQGLVFVEDGAVLTIEPGTVIKGKAGQEYEASALIISKGGKIMAEGTPTNPIIFTAEADDPYDLNDLPMTESGLWGGLIILGKSYTNNPSGTKNIEGISETEPRGQYGMPKGQEDPNDNSGVLRYISIRHGGTDIGDGNEINGLTMGAVGAGTTIDHIEVFYNADDGYEWFGGNVNASYLVSAFNKDDSFDYDEGFNGKGQFWFAIQAPNRGNMSGEHDGGNKPDDSTPYAIPYIYNATYIGSGVGSNNTKSKGILFRDNAGGKYFNSIFTETTGRGLEVEDLSSGEDSKSRMEKGDLRIANNIWWNIGTNNTTYDVIAPDVDGDKPYAQGFVRDYLESNDNSIEDPMLTSISREQNLGLDPRPKAGSPAFSKKAQAYYRRKGETNADGFFREANFIGAFGKNNWLSDWTYLSFAGVVNGSGGGNNKIPFAQTVEETKSAISDSFTSSDYGSITIYPSVISAGNATIQLSIKSASEVTLSVHSLTGEKVETIFSKYLHDGAYGVNWNTTDMQSGIYFVNMVIDNHMISTKVIIE